MKQIKRLEININTSSTLKKILTICLSALGTFGAAQAQIQVTQSATTAEVRSLVENVLLGSCVTVSNVNYIGPANAAGTFNAANTSFTMQNGILLTTGRAGLAVGPDNDNDAGLDQARVGDANLTTLAGVTTYDAVVLEFDFVPQDDTLRFNYVFGSEEYPEWVNSQYNDVFGFFISGPGINGPYVGNAANIALIPNTNIPVAINNVNNGYSATEPANGPCDNCAVKHIIFDWQSVMPVTIFMIQAFSFKRAVSPLVGELRLTSPTSPLKRVVPMSISCSEGLIFLIIQLPLRPRTAFQEPQLPVLITTHFQLRLSSLPDRTQ
jgi:hypothetical protein